MKTPNATHTPKAELKSTPWKVVGPHRRNGIIDTYSIESTEGFSVTINNHALDKEDATHIVKCVNSHEELLRCAKACLDMLTSDKAVGLPLQQWLEEAIANAEGGK